MGCQRDASPPAAGLPLLRVGAAALGLALSDAALAGFAHYFALLAEQGAAFNLTSVLDYEGVQRRHFLESLALGAALRDAGRLRGAERIVDIGAGAGFPGVPLKLVWPELRLALIEATQKKAAFLRLAVKALALTGVDVVAARAEAAAHRPGLRGRFDLAVARAVAPLPALAELTLPFVRIGGAVAAVKGSRLPAELAAAGAAIRRCGGGAPETLSLPGQPADGPLRILIIPKVRPTPAELPRGPGLAAVRPLR